MTHEEFNKNWSKKHRAVFAEMNRVLKAHGFKGVVTGLTMNVPQSVNDTMPANLDGCDEPCKAPPCAPDERLAVFTCPDGSGGFKIVRCCVKN